jgi:hypothetical protein
VTIVAAWMSAETGVGPAMASGSQTYSGICADLPVAPMKSSTQMMVMASVPNAMKSGGQVGALEVLAARADDRGSRAT